MLSETVLVLHAPIPLAVKVNVSVAQIVLKGVESGVNAKELIKTALTALMGGTA